MILTNKISEWVNETMYYIINERYINKRVTILTSNCEIDELEYNERIKSRLKEMCGVIHFPEEDLRNNIAKKINLKLKEKK